MSGGHFNISKWQLQEIKSEIELLILRNGKPKSKEEIKNETYYDDEWYEKYPEDLNHTKYSDEVIAEFKKAIKVINQASIYIHEIDYLLSGDTGEESFTERCKP